MPETATLAALKARFGTGGWLEPGDAAAPYLTDSRGTHTGRALGVALPRSVAEVSAALEICNAAGIGVVPQGGNTGRCAGATPDCSGTQLVLSLRRMNRILDIDPVGGTATVQAGCILASVRDAATSAGRQFPLSLGAEGSCQIGGNLATNAGGSNVLRYGNARDLVLGLEVVLPDGRVWDGLNRLRKNNTGYDLKDLFIGSEGTLGIITSAVLKLAPRPGSIGTALLALDDVSAGLALLARAQDASGNAVEAFELISRTALEFPVRHIPGCRDPFDEPHPWYVLMELKGERSEEAASERLMSLLASAFEDGLLRDATVAASAAHRQDFWRLREGIVETQKLEGASIKHDISLPLPRVPEFLAEMSVRLERELPGCRPCPFGHLGDGNLHYNISQPTAAGSGNFLARAGDVHRIVHDYTMALGGSFSAEHGIGLIKMGDMRRYKSQVELDMMRSIKQALDPNGIMNPGKVLPVPVQSP